MPIYFAHELQANRTSSNLSFCSTSSPPEITLHNICYFFSKIKTVTTTNGEIQRRLVV